MADQNKNKKITEVDGNFLKNMVLQVKLITRLMGDRRVSPLIKLLPWGSLIYLISPIDFISGALMPVIGAVDDVAIMWFGLSFFVQLCPPHVVDEHLAQLTGKRSSSQEGEVVDGEVIELDD